MADAIATPDPLVEGVVEVLLTDTSVSIDEAREAAGRVLDRIQSHAGTPKGFLIEMIDPFDSSSMSWISDERAGAERNAHERPNTTVTPLYPGRRIAPFAASMSRPLPMTERAELDGQIAELERRLAIATAIASETGDPRRCAIEMPWSIPTQSSGDGDPALTEIKLLDEALGFYADDEDRHLEGGEAFGSIPIEVGMKARQARERHRQRAFKEAAGAGDQNPGLG